MKDKHAEGRHDSQNQTKPSERVHLTEREAAYVDMSYQAIRPQQYISVLFFGELASHIAMNQVQVVMAESHSIAEVRANMADMFPQWRSFGLPIQQALNRELVDEFAIVNVGDEVAFFPALTE